MTFSSRQLLIGFLTVTFAASAEEPKVGGGFSIPQPDPVLSFPADHGSHPGFRIEWWYLTGHLFADEGKRRFGVQATFFRMAQKPGENEGGTGWQSDPLYLAHMALTDVANDRFLHEERLNRAGWDAWSKVGDLDVRNGNWTLKRVEGLGPGSALSESADGLMTLNGSLQSEACYELKLRPMKPPVLFGERGVSRKGESPEAASLYLTFPRLAAEGTVEMDGDAVAVSGELWMDHEISSSQLGRDQVGWDWISIQLFDGRELMAYVLRKPDGTPDRFSSLAWVDESGKVTNVDVDDFVWRSEGKWQSDVTGDVYPVRPRLSVTDPVSGQERTFRFEPVMEAQELSGGLGGVSYWEGAGDVIDESSGEAVGRAYLELTGYAKGDDLGRRLRGD
ncbi:MAG: carotenoid 1,2-hydratase [Verrucomicrobiae bacterium]|nr:carotenoid 1,2-hydratase [Verrucomicrobiae bacterium]